MRNIGRGSRDILAAFATSLALGAAAPVFAFEVEDAPVNEREAAEEFCEAASECSHPLAIVFADAMEQAAVGKGNERHGGRNVPFLDQPWMELARNNGGGFLTGQASKKLIEAVANYDDWTFDQFKRELLGAINYIAMAVIFEELREGVANGEIDDPNLAAKVGLSEFIGVNATEG